MGGHKIAGNPNNTKEEDADMPLKIRPIELIKHNPNLFHLECFNMQNQYEIIGGAKTVSLMALGGFMSLTYFMAGRATMTYNHYHNLHIGFFRLLFGAGIGGGVGYLRFGDRQRLHNAWVAERLRRRYPEAMTLT